MVSSCPCDKQDIAFLRWVYNVLMGGEGNLIICKLDCLNNEYHIEILVIGVS